LNQLDEIAQEKLGFIPEKSIIHLYKHTLWNTFLQEQKFPIETKGVYDPKTYSAHINKHAEIQTKIHEYYGHGIFCEHSTKGKELVNATKENINVQETYANTHFHNEGFALWVENYFCKQLGINNPINDSKLIYANDCELISDFFFKREYGFPESPTIEKAKEILNGLYNANDIQISVLYGSKKPESDVDLFIVSDTIKSQVTSWLDIYALTPKEFQDGIDNLLINITDPLFTGEVISGKKEFYLAKNKVLNAPITNDAINRNLISANNEALLENQSERNLKVSLSYIDTFTKNAQALATGHKYLTKNEVLKNVRTNS